MAQQLCDQEGHHSPVTKQLSQTLEKIMAAKTLNDLFIHALSDIYSAEKQLTKALKKQARASTA